MPKVIDFLYTLGRKYGRLTILTIYVKHVKPRITYAICKCDCGFNDYHVAISHITTGHIKSCGCQKRRRIK